MPAGLELLVKKIKKELEGKTNPKTKKAYTESDIYAIATAQWKKMKSKEYLAPKDQIVESYNSISVTEGVASPTNKSNVLKINGIAINAGVTRNNVRYNAEELQKAAKSLIGVPIMKNHSNKVEDIVGRVTNASYDEVHQNIPYAGDIMDKGTQEMIKDGRLNQVSIRAKYDKMENDEDQEDVVVVKGLSFLELSTVAIAGDPNATLDFNSFIKEEYDKNIQEEVNKMVEEVKKEEAKLSMETLKAENEKLLKEIESMKKSVEEKKIEVKKEEAPKAPEPKKEEPKEEKKDEDKESMDELKKKVKQLEESLLQGKGTAIKEAVPEVKNDFVREYVPGEGYVMYKKGVI